MYASDDKEKDGPDLAIVLADKAGKGKGKGPPGETSDDSQEEAGEGDDYDDVETSAVDDMFAAVKSGDKASFKAALSDYVEACVRRHMEEGAEG